MWHAVFYDTTTHTPHTTGVPRHGPLATVLDDQYNLIISFTQSIIKKLPVVFFAFSLLA